MADLPKPKTRRWRRFFRWCGIFVLVALLFAVLAGLYLNFVGLPDFLKRPLLAQLRAKGVQVEFGRMRLRWYRGIVVDDAKFTVLKPALRPYFTSTEAELNLNYRSLLDSNLKLDSVTIKDGNLVWPASKTNWIMLSNISTHVGFGDDEWVSVPQFQADFIGARINVTGSMTNASAIRDWKIFQPKKPKEPKRSLDQIASVLEKIHFKGATELTLNISGDATEPENVQGDLKFSSAFATTPWGSGTNLQVEAQLADLLNPAENNFIRVRTGSTETRWGSAASLSAQVKLASISAERDSFKTDVRVSARQLRSEYGKTDLLRFNGQVSQTTSNFVPTRISGTATTTNAETKWGKANSAEIGFTAATNTNPKLAAESWATWAKAEPFHLTWEMRAAGVETPKIKVEKVSLVGSWLAPDLKISALDGQLYEGGIQLTGKLNVATREASAKSSLDFDVKKVSPFLTPFGQRWIAKYSWEKPPNVEGEVRVVLPSWTNKEPDWRKEVLPTLQLRGSASVGRGAYRKVTATSASAAFTYSNMVWTLPHIRVNRPEGGADLNLVADDKDRSFHWRVQSEIDLKAIRHLLDEKVQTVFDDFQFNEPPQIRADIRGHWAEMENTSASAEIAMRNFSYRSNAVDKVNCFLVFTNQNLRVTDGRLDQGNRFLTAKRVELDFRSQKIFFTDVFGTVDGHVVAGLIGRKVAAHIAPYQFAEPPAVRLNGSLTIGKEEEANLHFDVDGTQFRWKWFQADRISGRLDWVGDTLLVTNVLARAYGGGRIAGWSDFNFAVKDGADYRYDIAVADINIQNFMKTISDKTNHLEGLIHGQMTLESGNTDNLKTLRGHGHVNLRDGLVWDVPVFGIFSPILNAIVPGAGNSRAREGTANFTVADGVISSADLEIRAPTVRLKYRGGVDFEQRIDARVEAELLRDTWLVGRIVSLALTPISKIFEYRVTGTLSEPQSEPVYIPDFLMMTLRPFHSIKKALTPDKETPGSVPGTSAIPP